MANILIYSGSSDFALASSSYYANPTGSSPTPFGFYDTDTQFQADADKVTNFCARRLGWPIENVELQDIQFWAAFEQAVTVYGNELYAYKQREDYLSLEGAEGFSYAAGADFSETLVTPNMGAIVRLSQQYGEEAGVGGNVNYYSGSIALTASVQDYDLEQWAKDNYITGSNGEAQIEIKRIFYQPLPASFQFLGDMGYNGTAIAMFGDTAGYTAYGANSFLMMPLSFDMQAIQQVEMYRDVLFSNYSFELINNKLRIFPLPTADDASSGRIWFQYINKIERIDDSLTSGSDQVNNISQYPYNNPIYSSINSVGRSWIFEYTLALAKEMLGYVRGKYQSVPIPGAEVSLNQGDLIASANTEKEALVTKLRDYFDQTSRQSLLERRNAESTARQSELDKVPMVIYVG
ncbi:hypothetical protein OAA18_00580 [bacterium]|nr:hypothetical protein [bacterium]